MEHITIFAPLDHTVIRVRRLPLLLEMEAQALLQYLCQIIMLPYLQFYPPLPLLLPV